MTRLNCKTISGNKKLFIHFLYASSPRAMEKKKSRNVKFSRVSCNCTLGYLDTISGLP